MSEKTLVEAVDRVAFAVRDIAEAERVYTRMLGRTPSWRHTDPGGGTTHLIYRLANMALEFIAPLDEGSWARVVSRHLEERGEGLISLYLKTSDAEGAARELCAVGVSAVAFPEGEARSGGHVRRWRNVMIPANFTRGLSFMLSEARSAPASFPPAQLREGVAEEEAISALDHVVVMTADAGALKAFLGEKFGIRLALDHSKPEWGVRQLFFRLGGVTIEVVEPLDRTRAPKEDHYGGLAWRAESVGAVSERLAREGADVSEVRVGRKKGTEVATIRKPTMGVPTLLVGPQHVTAQLWNFSGPMPY